MFVCFGDYNAPPWGMKVPLSRCGPDRLVPLKQVRDKRVCGIRGGKTSPGEVKRRAECSFSLKKRVEMPTPSPGKRSAY